jgi:hypothetical protein
VELPNVHLQDTCEVVGSAVSENLCTWATISRLEEKFVNGHGHQIHANTAAGVEASTRTFFVMLGCAIIHASRFARKFAFGARSGITLVHAL